MPDNAEFRENSQAVQAHLKEQKELYRGTEKDNADFDITLPRAFYLLLHL